MSKVERSVSIANEFLKLPGASGGLTQMQLQKLAFIANGWNTVINDRPLIGEQPQAWDYGPVYPDLYDHTKYFGKEKIGRLITPDDDQAAKFFLRSRPKAEPYEANLSIREGQVVTNVWKRYGNMTGIALSRLTHQPGTPWYETFNNDGKNEPIPLELIADHYRRLAARASTAAA